MDFTVQWLGHLFQSLDERLDDEAKGAILGACSETCTRGWAIKAQEIRAQFAASGPGDRDIARLLDAFCRALPGGGPEVQIEGSTIHWRFSGDDCPCPISRLARTPDLCLCGIGHVRGMLEPLLGRPLAVKLERSRLRGDSECAYRIEL